MLRTHLSAALLAALVVSLAAALVADAEGRRGHHELLRAQAADTVLDGLLALAGHADQVLRLLSEITISGEIDRPVIAGLRPKVDQTVARLRRDISLEIGLEGGGPADAGVSEVEELAVLSAIEADFHQALGMLDQVHDQQRPAKAGWLQAMDLLDGRDEDGLRRRLAAAIDEERRESTVADASADSAFGAVRTVARVYAVFSVVLLLSLAYFFSRRLGGPFRELMAGTHAMQEGDLARRIAVRSRDEFGLIGASVNALAEQRQRQHGTLIDANDRLEHAVAVRTEELRLANEGLSRADALRRQFFADISHELRTPITAIRGEAEIALRASRGGSEPVENYKFALQHIRDISTQIGRLIDDLLFIARSDAPSQRLSMESVSLAELLDSVHRSGKALGDGIGIDVEYQRPSDDVVVLGDRDRLHQLFLILLDNALCHSETKAPVMLSSSIQGERVEITVLDRGVGLNDHDLAHVFHRFYRGDRANEHAADGAGLGLPIAKAIVDAHAGAIEMESAPGHGTTVHVWLNVFRHQRGVA